MSPTDVVELKKYVKRLNAAALESNEEDILSILAILKTEFKITEQVIRESKVGLAVGKLRQHESAKIASVAKDLVSSWKSAVGKQKPKTPVSATPKPNNTAGASSKPPAATAAAPVPQNTGVPRTAKSDGVSVNTGDKVRDKCTELVYDSLASDSGAPTDQILKRAQEVEKAVYKNHNNSVTGEYRNKIRSLFVNLKDKNNPELREGVVSGEILAEKLVTMTSEEMASEEQKAALKKIKEANLFHSFSAQESQAETEAFQCGKCKQRKCRYRQAQTRSADEPMTTFVTCTVCGNRWKFS
ncbi:hypothetical protein H1R20_g4938, partial [Candolleomyces eurysporus]